MEAENNKNWGGSAPGNPKLTPPGLEGCPAQSGEGYQELSLLSEEQRDLSESLPRLSGSAKSASRESKSIKLRLKKQHLKKQENQDHADTSLQVKSK